MMKKFLIICSALLLGAVAASAQSFFSWSPKDQEAKVKFQYDVNFEYNFDNREFDKGKEQFTQSATLYGARLTPSIGLKINQSRNTSHKIMMGIDVMKEFGKSPVRVNGSPEADNGLENTRLFRELTLYYGIESRIGRWKIKGYAGMFPRYFSEGDYSKAFYSDSLKFYDNNLEGALIKARGPKSFFEFSFDWNGKFGQDRREQFIVSSYGKHDFTGWFSLGYALKYHHYAKTANYGSVVDDGLLQPFARFGFEYFAGIQDLSLTLSWYQAFQADRRLEHGGRTPGGAEIGLGLRNWNVGLKNNLYIGRNLMPFYNSIDNGGFKYGHDVYTGSPFYRVTPFDEDKWSVYDMMEVFYEPHIADFLDLRLSIVAHFPDGFRYGGMQQKLALVFNLDRLLNPETPRRQTGRGSRRSRKSAPGIIIGI
ncbi:MAG: hypothetical protein ACI4UJ_10180 [Candidatus Cryptobacteroides sp.]